MELEEKLKILNKPPAKSIKVKYIFINYLRHCQLYCKCTRFTLGYFNNFNVYSFLIPCCVDQFQTKFGDIYDCINIYKQPSFDHPLLRNHKIQMKPNLNQEEQIAGPISNVVPSVVRSKLEGCPSETVPIRRTTKEELINAKLLSTWTKPRHYVSVEPVADKVYYGGSAKIVVANPSVDQNKFSTGQIWIQNGPAEEVNSIEFGWAVNPQLFGDNEAQVFGLWMVLHPQYSFGEHMNAGTYGGDQRAFYFSVYRDPEIEKWWFINGIDNARIGYWPKEIFTHLANNASVIGYGGVAGADLWELTPPMGHGHLPVFDSKYTCCMLNMKVANDRGNFVDFDTSKVRLNRDTKTSCYDLIFPSRDTLNGIIMFFGGPGGNCP
ncbi:hypothetical protein MKX03_006686 [Papaver bracteatum]|nr:hypothetical protein MKX03_006686 [Papaver bracteatum]